MWQNDLTYSFWAFLKKFVIKCDKKRKLHKFQNNFCKVWQKVIAKCGKYYKVRQSLFQSNRYYKLWQVITKCKVRQSLFQSNRYYKLWQVITKCKVFCKMQLVLQSVTIITKWDVTLVLLIFWSCIFGGETRFLMK